MSQEKPLFLNPRMQAKYELDSKTADVNVVRAVATYENLRKLQYYCMINFAVMRHLDEHSHKEVFRELEIHTSLTRHGYSTVKAVEGKRWDEIKDGEPFLQYIDFSSAYAIDKNGVEIENYLGN